MSDTGTKADIDPGNVLAAAVGAKLKHVVIIGETTDGEFYTASSRAYGPDVLWDLERTKLALLHHGGAMPGAE